MPMVYYLHSQQPTRITAMTYRLSFQLDGDSHQEESLSLHRLSVRLGELAVLERGGHDVTVEDVTPRYVGA